MLSFLKPQQALEKQVFDPAWRKTPKGVFQRLIAVKTGEDSGLHKVSGVYVLWHRGIRPRWIHIGATDNLAQTINVLRDHPDIVELENHGGVFVTWSPIMNACDGVVVYLNRVLDPIFPLNWAGVRVDPEARPIETKIPV